MGQTVLECGDEGSYGGDHASELLPLIAANSIVI